MGTDCYLGSIGWFAGNFAPQGWLFCDGHMLSVQQNPALFSLLGTIYGGDGRTSFAIPDMRPRAADGRIQRWEEVAAPRPCICVEGLYPSRP